MSLKSIPLSPSVSIKTESGQTVTFDKLDLHSVSMCDGVVSIGTDPLTSQYLLKQNTTFYRESFSPELSAAYDNLVDAVAVLFEAKAREASKG